ncbi:MAG: sulfate adenylyltransferase, partial [Chloroflexota bacterium]|nr:sulfate adenylyltransferase [Chloroflexota bacterium]
MSIAPYGGSLVNRMLEGAAADEAHRRATSLPQVRISSHTLSDLYLIAVGGLSPLTGFMGSADYESVLEEMTLANGLPWSIPVTLPVSHSEAATFGPGDEIALIADGEVAALVKVGEVFA